MACDAVFYYGKTEARTAYRLGMAFIYAVEALEYSVQLICGDTDTVIGYGELYAVIEAFTYGNVNGAARDTVLYGVVAEVEDYLVQQSLIGGDRFARSAYGEGDTVALGYGAESVCNGLSGEQ